MIDLNPLDILKKRKMNYLPVHFLQVKLSDFNVLDNNLENWVSSKLKGRYYIARIPSIDSSGKLRSTAILALEDQKEMTYFMLAYPQLRRT